MCWWKGLMLFVPTGTSATGAGADGEPESRCRQVVACLSWMNGTMRWWRSTARIAAMWPRGWCMPPMTKQRAARFSESIAQSPGYSAELRSQRAVGGGDRFPLARVGVRPGAAGERSGIVPQHGGDCVWRRRGRTSSGDTRNEDEFTQLAHCLRDTRHPYGPRQHPLWRLRPERWLESLVSGDVSVVDDRLDASCRYSQVPAFSAADRAMIDVLTTTRAGRLAVVELKADEDIHLPLQGLDYWARVDWHHAPRRISALWIFRRRGIVGREAAAVSGGSCVARASLYRYLLRYLSPEIEWEFVGIDERWREGVKVVFRKRPAAKQNLFSQARSFPSTTYRPERLVFPPSIPFP